MQKLTEVTKSFMASFKGKITRLLLLGHRKGNLVELDGVHNRISSTRHTFLWYPGGKPKYEFRKEFLTLRPSVIGDEDGVSRGYSETNCALSVFCTCGCGEEAVNDVPRSFDGADITDEGMFGPLPHEQQKRCKQVGLGKVCK
ncbi:hypothetical protein OCU04_011334 [Sclerotinia nivalis]|uniref:Uncharacterized protein n=1 Tax=Sclerotinia nivalis TaxID=352851 RepID=A0A9X0DDN4_9HELO|nr:hypothetical protein OCU04_011334 [Sclerotinia nivalis]